MNFKAGELYQFTNNNQPIHDYLYTLITADQTNEYFTFKVFCIDYKGNENTTKLSDHPNYIRILYSTSFRKR